MKGTNAEKIKKQNTKYLWTGCRVDTMKKPKAVEIAIWSHIEKWSAASPNFEEASPIFVTALELVSAASPIFFAASRAAIPIFWAASPPCRIAVHKFQSVDGWFEVTSSILILAENDVGLFS